MKKAFESRESITFEKDYKLFAMMHRPLTNEPVAAVMVIHGFGSHKIGTNRCYVKLAQSLAKEGIACLRIDLRGCGDSEGELSLTNFEDFIDDCLTGLNFLKQHPQIDSHRLGIFGSSLGGALAIYAAYRFQDVKTLVQWAAVASGEAWLKDWQRLNGTESLISNSYQGIELSPLFQEQFFKMRADLLSKELTHVSILNMHGENDQVISLEHQLAYKLQRADLPNSHFLSFNETAHAFALSTHFPQILKETVEWFKNQL